MMVVNALNVFILNFLTSMITNAKNVLIRTKFMISSLRSVFIVLRNILTLMELDAVSVLRILFGMLKLRSVRSVKEELS